MELNFSEVDEPTNWWSEAKVCKIKYQRSVKRVEMLCMLLKMFPTGLIKQFKLCQDCCQLKSGRVGAHFLYIFLGCVCQNKQLAKSDSACPANFIALQT